VELRKECAKSQWKIAGHQIRQLAHSGELASPSSSFVVAQLVNLEPRRGCARFSKTQNAAKPSCQISASRSIAGLRAGWQ